MNMITKYNIFESFNGYKKKEEYPYSMILFRFDNDKEFRDIIEVFYEQGVENYTSIKLIIRELKKIINRFKNPELNILLIDLKFDFFSIIDKDEADDLINNREYHDVDPHLYNFYDLIRFKDKPSYEPRKIDRTLESYNEIIYNHAVIKVYDNIHLEEALDKIFTKFKFTWCDGTNNIPKYNYYAYPMHIILNYKLREIFLASRDDLINDDIVLTIIKRDHGIKEEINSMIYDYSDKLDIKSLFYKTPSYVPKKFNRSIDI